MASWEYGSEALATCIQRMTKTTHAAHHNQTPFSPAAQTFHPPPFSLDQLDSLPTEHIATCGVAVA